MTFVGFEYEMLRAVLLLVFGAALAGFLWELLDALQRALDRRKGGHEPPRAP